MNTGMPLPMLGLSPSPPPARSCRLVPAPGLVLIHVTKTSPSTLPDGRATVFAMMLGCQSLEWVAANQVPSATSVCGVAPILKV